MSAELSAEIERLKVSEQVAYAKMRDAQAQARAANERSAALQQEVQMHKANADWHSAEARDAQAKLAEISHLIEKEATACANTARAMSPEMLAAQDTLLRMLKGEL
jgi:predicted  nucleic acid-binding Zn-ribbon protein